MSVLNTLQYKQCLRSLTLPKCIFTIYRPEKKSKMVQTVQTERSINSNIRRFQL